MSCIRDVSNVIKLRKQLAQRANYSKHDTLIVKIYNFRFGFTKFLKLIVNEM